MKRFYIVDGDETTAGGIVVAGQVSAGNAGKKLVILGDQVVCRKCKRTGVIVGEGPRHESRFDGKQPALNNDLCVCRCKPAPRLINSRTDMGQDLTTEEVVKQGYGRWIGINDEKASAVSVAIASITNDSDGYDQHFLLVDRSSKQPVKTFAYGLKTPSGEHHEIVRASGQTLVAPMNEPQVLILNYAVQTKIGVNKK